MSYYAHNAKNVSPRVKIYFRTKYNKVNDKTNNSKYINTEFQTVR